MRFVQPRIRHVYRPAAANLAHPLPVSPTVARAEWAGPKKGSPFSALFRTGRKGHAGERCK
jgi:hypothetical protein